MQASLYRVDTSMDTAAWYIVVLVPNPTDEKTWLKNGNLYIRLDNIRQILLLLGVVFSLKKHDHT